MLKVLNGKLVWIYKSEAVWYGGTKHIDNWFFSLKLSNKIFDYGRKIFMKYEEKYVDIGFIQLSWGMYYE